MNNYAFIFVRGGSKGLPGKNIKPLAGKPLLEYSIEIAKACSSISKIFVSTDDSDIAKVAIAAGAELIERPADLATDTSAEWYSWRHAINWVQEKYGDFDHFVSLPATSPLRSVEDVESSLVRLEEDSADICISITPANRSPFFNMVTRTEQGTVELVNRPECEVIRRQDAPEVFDITTVVYTAKPQFVLEHYGIFSGKVTSIEVPKLRAIDIDDIYDFKLAEAIVMGDE
ncbi:acylneuraminate cytidylyltransferase family protein [Vibrio alfacsensis]|uniref:acylneuraminate cytidylyltransferase family protein n=1 Tax=Vibrio alfacsensis TaxID=1074311 RepID=UPI002ADD9EB3|nr:acylneuraminate cytidylyltransferase family protein [Vibrio alfacsensis]WQE76432.1 acylneuraminate cytidylyltransferase family protein [Vibrio alfacsensis]